MCLAAIYLIGMNVFLSTPLFDKAINAEPLVVDIHFRRGWSLFPGNVHATGLSIRGTDSNVEWVLKLDKADFDINLLVLARQRFEISRVHGTGISFRIRQKLETAPSPEVAKTLPPIDGLPPFTVRPKPPTAPETWNDAAWKLWTVRLERITADDVREIWIDSGHFVGSADIKGRFYLKPIRRANVGPAHIDFHRGAFSMGDVVMAENLGGTVDATLAEFDPRTTDGAGMLHHTTAATAMHLGLPDIANLPLPMPSDAKLTGRIDVDRLALRVESGILKGDSHVSAASKGFVFDRADEHATTAVALRADVASAGASDQLTFRAEVRGFEAAHRDVAAGTVGPTLVSVPRADISGDARELDLTKPLGDLHLAIDLLESGVNDLAAVARSLPKSSTPSPVTVHAGRLGATAHAEAWLAETRASGTIAFTFKELDAEAPAARVRGDIDVDASAGNLRWVAGTIESGSLDVRAPAFSATHGAAALRAAVVVHAKAHGWDLGKGVVGVDEANVTLDDVSLASATSGREGVMIHQIALRGAPGVLTTGDPLAHVGIHAVVEGGRVHDAAALNAILEAGGELKVASQGGAFSAIANADVVGHVASGKVALKTEAVGIASGVQTVTGNIDLAAVTSGWNLRSGRVAMLDGRLVVTALDGRIANTETSAYHAERVEASGHTEDLDLSNGGPLLGRSFEGHVVVANGNVPDARALQAMMPKDGVLAIESGAARLDADVHLSSAAKSGNGRVNVTLTNAGIRLNETHFAGDFVVAGQVRGFDPARSLIDIAGSRISMRDVAVVGSSTDTERWHGDIMLQQATLRLDDAPQLDADVTLDARDASPILAILLKDSLPKIFAGLTHMPRLGGNALLTLGGHTLALRNVVAQGGDIEVRGLYAVQGDHKKGAFIVEKGPFSAGLKIGDDGVGLRFFGLNDWLRSESADVGQLIDHPALAKTAPAP